MKDLIFPEHALEGKDRRRFLKKMVACTIVSPIITILPPRFAAAGSGDPQNDGSRFAAADSGDTQDDGSNFDFWKYLLAVALLGGVGI